MKKPKVSTSFRISQTAHTLLKKLMQDTGLSATGCVELAIRELAIKRGVL